MTTKTKKEGSEGRKRKIQCMGIQEKRRKRRKINKRERSARSIWTLPGGGKIG
jgi:hypothetical protein